MPTETMTSAVSNVPAEQKPPKRYGWKTVEPKFTASPPKFQDGPYWFSSIRPKE